MDLTRKEKYDVIDSRLEAVRRCLTETDLLIQLAEESAELSQAALKMARYLEGRNPLSKEAEEQVGLNLPEEYADVLLCARALTMHYGDPVDAMLRKSGRWIYRLKKNGGEDL